MNGSRNPPDFIVRPAGPEDYTLAGELAAGVFSHGDPRFYEHFLHHWIASRPYEPGFDYRLHRLGVKEGQIITHLRIRGYTLRYGMAQLHVGGVSEACTYPRFRRQGYSGMVLQEAIAFLAEQGAHLALLNTTSEHYDRYGFSPVWPYYYLEIDSAEAAALDAPLHLRDVRPTDVPAMAILYERHWEGRVTFAREPRMWFWRTASGERPYQQIIEDANRAVHGYIAGYSLTDERVEAVADSPEAALTILKAGGEAFQNAGLDTIRWLIPPDDALVSFARQYLSVTVSARYLPRGGWMARLIDPRGFINTLMPEIIAQAVASDPQFEPDALVVEPGAGGVQIGLRKRPETVSELNYYDFIQVVFGSLRPAALAVRPSSRIQPEGRHLLELLFPPRMAALGCWDWF